MSEFYEMTIAGLERKLPLCAINDKLDIAAFIMLGDVEITVASAKALLEKVPEFDCIITAECKGIPLAYEMARQSGKKYVVARKGQKKYFINPISVETESITTAGKQVLSIGEDEISALKGKRVLIADDVVSTGESLAAVEKLVEMAGGNIVGRAFVLAEGDAKDMKNIVYLEPLPLFFK